MRQQRLPITILSIYFSFVLHFGNIQAADPVIIKPTTLGYNVCFSPDGKYLAIVGGQTLQLWDVERRKIENRTNLLLWAYTVDFSHDGELLAVGGTGFEILIYGFPIGSTKPKLLRHLNTKNFTAMRLDFSPDGRWLAARGKGRWNTDTSKVFNLWNDEVMTLQHPNGLFWPMRLLFSPNGKLLAASGSPVTLWEVDSWQESNLKPGGVDYGISFTPTSLTLAGGTLGNTGVVSQWRLKTGMTSTIKLAQIVATTYIEYSPGGNYLAVAGGRTGGAAGLIEIWKTNPKKLVKTLKGHTNKIHSLDFTSDGRLLASCSGDGTVCLWNISDIADPATHAVDATDKLPLTWAKMKIQ